MLDNIKHLIDFKSVDKNIQENNFEQALKKLNKLVSVDFRPSETYLKRGLLCKKLLMSDVAYSDFTYIINHCENKTQAYYERLFLNYDISNYYEAINDANILLGIYKDNFDIMKIKFLSLVYSQQKNIAKNYIIDVFENNKYKTLRFLFNEVAYMLSQDELAKGLRLLEIIDLIDKNNPLKLLNEANIYDAAGQTEKRDELKERIENEFPKYFVSHFKFLDMYQEKDIMEIGFLLELSAFDKKQLFKYPLTILEGYKNYLEGHIISSKECFEKAIQISPHKPEAYVLLAQTLQLMSGYESNSYQDDAEANYIKAMNIYSEEGLHDKADDMRRQIKHLNSDLVFI